MTRLVVNRCHGGFGISDAAVRRIREIGGCEHAETLEGETYADGSRRSESYFKDSNDGHRDDTARACPALLQVVEEMGPAAGGFAAKLRIVEIPDDAVDWYVDEYDGLETVREGRSW